MSLVRGVLAAAGIRSQSELNSMSSEDHRNTLIVELAGHSNQAVPYFQSLDNSALAAAGAVAFTLRESRIRSDADLRQMSTEDHRNTLIVEANFQTQIPIPQLQGLDNFSLTRVLCGEDDSFLRGVLIFGNFRSQAELNQMSREDHRNTLIVELVNHSNQTTSYFQSLNNFSLASAGAAMVYLRKTRIRRDDELALMSTEDHRNTLIVEVAAQTTRQDLQSFSTFDLVRLALGIPLLEDAQKKMANFYRRTGGSLGPLGAPKTFLRRSGSSWVQDFALGQITLEDFQIDPKAFTFVEAEVKIAAVKCFGTEDSSGTDETYLVISLVSVDPDRGAQDRLVTTVRTAIDNNVFGGKVFCVSNTVGKLRITGGGLRINVVIVDHESGNADDLRDKIAAALNAGANEGARIIAGAASGGDQRLAGAVGDITEFDVGGVKPFKVLTLGLADLIAQALSDDVIGEHTFVVPAENISALLDQATFSSSFRRTAELGPDIQFNWPPRPQDEFLFSGGGGSYKIYFTITPFGTFVPVEPRIP